MTQLQFVFNLTASPKIAKYTRDLFNQEISENVLIDMANTIWENLIDRSEPIDWGDNNEVKLYNEIFAWPIRVEFVGVFSGKKIPFRVPEEKDSLKISRQGQPKEKTTLLQLVFNLTASPKIAKYILELFSQKIPENMLIAMANAMREDLVDWSRPFDFDDNNEVKLHNEILAWNIRSSLEFVGMFSDDENQLSTFAS